MNCRSGAEDTASLVKRNCGDEVGRSSAARRRPLRNVRHGMNQSLKGTDEQSRLGSLPLFLSLFLVLLAFFILLNAISSPEVGRRTRVVDSVHTAFPLGFGVSGEDGLVDASSGETISAVLKGRLSGLFRRYIPVVEIHYDAGGNPMFVSMPWGEVYRGNEPRPKRKVLALLRELAPILAAPGEGLRLETTFVLQVGGRLDAAAGGARVGQLAQLAETVIALGALKSDISIGLEPGEEGVLRIIFHRRSAPGAVTRG